MSLKKKFLKSKPICKVTFSLSKQAANGAKSVSLVGDFNNWDLEKGVPMKINNGVFKATLDLQKGEEYQFRYLIDNESWENDWEADKYVQSPFGVDNSVVTTVEALLPDKGSI